MLSKKNSGNVTINTVEKGIPQAVGYLAPCLCKKCKPVTLQPAGAPGPVSNPNVVRSTVYQGERLPHFLKMSNVALPAPGPFAPPSDGDTTSCGAPVWTGYEGAVATSAGSAPVAVYPAYPSPVGKSEGKAFVGVVGGKGCTSVEPAYGGANNSGVMT